MASRSNLPDLIGIMFPTLFVLDMVADTILAIAVMAERTAIFYE